MTAEAFRTRLWWPSLLVVAVWAYFYSLGGLHNPTIGDEAPYIQIVRLTAESGQWLPLKTPPGLENTKPPLLFWLGILVTDSARQWSLFRLRVPITLFTFLTAGLVFLLARRVAKDGDAGYLAALSFLGFASTLQYGRPFLTNLPETLFAFLPFFLLIYFRGRLSSWGIFLWPAVGLSIGLACLFKSFVLVVPLGLALGWSHLAERRWDVKSFLRHDAGKLSAALVTGLACFALWPLLDPDPMSVIRQFVIEQNVGKLGSANYLRDLFSGPYPLHRIWLGNFANAGLLALPLAHLAVNHWRRRDGLSRSEKTLWIFILSFLLVYSVPSQRQENYLLPTVPALAVLLGMEWKRIRPAWFYLFNVPIVVGLLILIRLTDAISSDALPSGSYLFWQRALPWLALGVLLGGFIIRRASYAFHLAVLLAIGSLAAALAPFEGPVGRYDQETQLALAGKVVHVPSNFVAKYELHRFILPHSDIEGYDPADRQRVNQLLRTGQIVAMERPLGQTVADPFEVHGRRLTLRSRHRPGELVRILVDREINLLVRQELIVQRRSP